MNVKFDRSFSKSIDKLKNKQVKQRLIKLIELCEKASSIDDIRNLKKLKGFKSYYRIRIGDYRVGLELTDKNTLLFIVIAHRKEIYKKFP